MLPCDHAGTRSTAVQRRNLQAMQQHTAELILIGLVPASPDAQSWRRLRPYKLRLLEARFRAIARGRPGVLVREWIGNALSERVTDRHLIYVKSCKVLMHVAIRQIALNALLCRHFAFVNCSNFLEVLMTPWRGGRNGGFHWFR